ncbi:MAG: hypothetical protein LIO44_07845 [Eubacterium sp.]|nr:hypothetical protein [Eubacterium sp.]
MGKGKIKDLLSATKDEAIGDFLDSELTPEIVKNAAELVVSEGPAAIFGMFFGAVAPRINSIRLSYKENRFERHVETALSVMTNRIESLENNYNSLNKEMQEKFSGTYMEWLFDNLYDEKQEEKISCYVNGYINMMSNDANDNLMLMFFDTISQLTQLDIEILRLYSIDSQDDITKLCERNNLEYEQTAMIKEKLTRLGLLNSRNDEQRDNNVDLIVDYLKKSDKENRSRNPKNVKLPRINKPNRSESYKITSLGNSYLQINSE